MGVEPNDKARVYAQQRNKIQTTAVLPELKEYQGSFSCITLWHVLEHVHDLNDTIEKIKSLLKPEGVLIIAVPNCNSWDANKYGKFWAAYDVPRHLYHFTETTLKRLFSEHAFVVRNVLPQKLDAYYVSMLSEKYLTGGSNYFKALFFGFWSNFQARKTGVGHSSQIFILSVKKA
jgi:SAM-dependent methyltransferase